MGNCEEVPRKKSHFNISFVINGNIAVSLDGLQLGSLLDVCQGLLTDNSRGQQSLHLPLGGLDVGTEASCSLSLQDRVGLSLQSVQPPLVRFGPDVGFEGVGVDEILAAVNTVELAQTSLVVVHSLVQKFLHLPHGEIGIYLIQILCSSFRPPAFLEVSVSNMILLTLVGTSHNNCLESSLVEVNQAI